jgi:hypothetical protein
MPRRNRRAAGAVPLPRPDGHRGEARRGLRCATEPVCVLAGPSSEGDPGWQGLLREPRKPLSSNRLRRFAGEAESHSKSSAVPPDSALAALRRHWPSYYQHHSANGSASTSHCAHWQLRNEGQGIQARQRRHRNRAALRPGIALLPADHPSPSSRPRRTRPVQAQPLSTQQEHPDHARSLTTASRRDSTMVTPDHTSQRHDARSHNSRHVTAQSDQPPARTHVPSDQRTMRPSPHLRRRTGGWGEGYRWPSVLMAETSHGAALASGEKTGSLL